MKKSARPEIVSVTTTHDEDFEGYSSSDSVALSGRKSLLKSKITVKEHSVTKKYKQRTLLISSRGVTYRYRHLMQDLGNLLPHTKKDAKLDSKSRLEDLNELAELNNCNNCLYFEMRKHQDMVRS